MSEESIENTTKSASNFALTLADHHLLPDISFNGHCLANNIYILKKLITLCICHTPGPQLKNLNTDFTLRHCLFGSVKLTKNADLDKYKYSGHSMGFDSRSEFSLPDGTIAKKFHYSWN